MTLIITGPTGTGKTYYACALGDKGEHHCCRCHTRPFSTHECTLRVERCIPKAENSI